MSMQIKPHSELTRDEAIMLWQAERAENEMLRAERAMTKQLTGPALVAYLRDNPTSDAMRAAADEIVGLRYAVATSLRACKLVNRVVDGVDFAALAKGLRGALSGEIDD